MMDAQVAIVGAGSWGTALAQLAATAGNDVRLWARKEEVARGINADHVNPRYLADARLSERIEASTDIVRVVGGADAVVIVTPSSVMRETACAIAAHVGAKTPVALAAKGVEADTGMLPVEVFDEVLGGLGRLAALTGPNHAEEVVRGVPSGTVVSSYVPRTARFFQSLLSTESFRIYVGNDVVGAEVCAAYKNVIAIAVGASYGLGMGDNTAALLMTRGLAEMSRLVAACGGNAMTCMGLAGMGDLEVTCMSPHSRNRTFGYELAQGVTLDAYRARTHMVVEGALACRTLHDLALAHDVDLPLARTVRAIVWEGYDVVAAAQDLLDRPQKPEF
ncbi:NAD(P)H-dependent glycerol-3-phosphate dehydrogenase [Slackia exigua]|uniref:NAD(P)H-dependent glycerol-3-phosphate dehydrogenase n=1 Tax=Slackia exigua TaxID=84109 RepID=UPI00254BD032|nr:NAD(P)H-dependent glycerol-3-phosphate dehydrogenase [Slackia exigua]MDK7723611.1 NAD(P)H-dependent glycerol-3-phosphate dehydrogenase [Slackia exigua]MDK7725777.1 NAD(P)H-dependent glycerol-3-phosphate dehydrogenase [Slackia exigua]